MTYEPVSPFTSEVARQMLEEEGLSVSRLDEQRLFLRLACQFVPHNVYIDVDEQAGYCAIMQDNLIIFSPGLTCPPRLLEACRFALMLNGELLHGSFALIGRSAPQLCFRVTLPTQDAMLTLGQLQTTLGLLCCEIDLCYPLIQQVLWGALTADEALAEYRRRRDADLGNADDPGGSNDGDHTPDSGSDRAQRLESDALDDEARTCTSAEIDRIDEQFLASYDSGDPFSAALAEALRQQRARHEDAS